MDADQYCLPFVFVNLAGEMLYILIQRLIAQKVPADKAKSVIQDITRTMFSDILTQEVFKKQKLYSHQQLRDLFVKLAHASVMRLNKASMNKLYDLMVMGWKYTVFVSDSPTCLMLVSLRHLFELEKACCHLQGISPLLQSLRERLMDRYDSLTLYEWSLLRESALNFLKGYKTRISLLLQLGHQSLDGSIVLPSSSSESKEGKESESKGTSRDSHTRSSQPSISYYDSRTGQLLAIRPVHKNKDASTPSISTFHSSNSFKILDGSRQVDQPSRRPVLGSNMYMKTLPPFLGGYSQTTTSEYAFYEQREEEWNNLWLEACQRMEEARRERLVGRRRHPFLNSNSRSKLTKAEGKEQKGEGKAEETEEDWVTFDSRMRTASAKRQHDQEEDESVLSIKEVSSQEQLSSLEHLLMASSKETERTFELPLFDIFAESKERTEKGGEEDSIDIQTTHWRAEAKKMGDDLWSAWENEDQARKGDAKDEELTGDDLLDLMDQMDF